VGMEMGPGRKGLSKPYILQAAEDSLQRLQTDYIDLYQAHADDPETPLEETAEYEPALEPLCREKGLGVLPYFPLASGFLTGKYRSEKDLAGRARGDMVKKYLDDRGFRILDALDRVARHYHSAPATVALAWLIARPGITAPIASATSLDQLNELMKSLELELDPSAIELLNRASA
ncbi:MAG: aldo/keto reductase, partial [Candidatus Deferrimicrobiaceae bacterium]